MTDFQQVGVAGAGAFGTALALVAHKAGRRVTLWGRDSEQIAAMRAAGENAAYLPGIAVPSAVEITSEPAALQAAEIILLVVPAQATRAAAGNLAPFVRPGVPVIACAKGIERATGLLQTGILAECIILPSIQNPNSTGSDPAGRTPRRMVRKVYSPSAANR